MRIALTDEGFFRPDGISPIEKAFRMAHFPGTPDPETPCRCDHCIWQGKIVHTLAEDCDYCRCPECGEPVTILEE